MIKKIISASIVLLFSTFVSAQEKVLTKGMKINSSTKIKKGIYQLSASSNMNEAIIIIEGNDIVVDFNNALMQGSDDINQPDKFTGIAILIRNSRNITIKNAKAKGYKLAVMAVDVQSLTIENSDFSYNYRPQLNSTQEKEDISDWMSYHQNENDEWLRYGAAMYLKNCDMAVIRENKVTGSQNALMMTGSSDGLIYNNDFSFNSGIGLGMYRSERNKVLHNRIIFNVRGYSHGVYNRGQDSAGILVYEQSNENLFYRNAVTHGGDGFFLWAGQSTMDSGKGGCNDNVLMGNDFSYAPTNGIEVTFSRNYIADNRIYECDHGIWAGYSYETNFRNNKIRNNRIGIALEHGQNNMISYNVFFKNKEAIRLWSRKEQPAGWGYAQNRDTRSRDYIIASNSFNNDSLVYNFKGTRNLNIFSNTYSGVDEVFKMDSTVVNLDTSFYERLYQLTVNDTNIILPEVDSAMNPFKGSIAYAGRKNIRMTAWGPYDFRSPIIWHNNPADTSRVMHFELVGPKGNWKVLSVKGVDSLSARSGNFPATITAIKQKSSNTDILIELEYVGEEIVTPFGQTIPAGKPYIFPFRKYFQPIQWEVKWFSYDTLKSPLDPKNEVLPVGSKPFKTDKTDRLEYAWWGGINEGNKIYPQFLTHAEGEVVVEAGEYEIGITWDDAVRLFVDDSLILNAWNHSMHKFDESPHKKIQIALNGKHRFRLEHLEKGGFATLSFRLKPVISRN
ncbi:MAG: right-handed parallel beta-helix repeat-containing protein [Chitinophagaceae bacterium]|nr:right-handed parallel beta-helix repeat-containing protein [Chitinophagaceae bacterium]